METIKKLSNHKRSDGILNSQFGKIWITNGKNNKKIYKENIDNLENLGYYKGRVIKHNK